MTSNHSESGKFSYLRDLPTEELEQLLQQDFILNENSESDPDYIKAIMEVIMSRERKDPDERNAMIDAAWEDFQENYHGQSTAYEPVPFPEYDSSTIPQVNSVSRKKAPRRIIGSIAVAAAIICLLVSFASASGWLKALVTWTSETFSFVSPKRDVEVPELDDPYLNLRLEVADYTDLEVVPTWAPEGTVMESDIRIVEREDTTTIDCIFTSDIGRFTIWYRIYDTIPKEYPVSYEWITDHEQYVHNGTEYHIVSNNQNHTVSWIEDGMECMIQGDISEDDLKQMVDSILKE